MAESSFGPNLDAKIAHWRMYLRRRNTVHGRDLDELEDHLRTQVATLLEADLSEDEAFLVAAKRMGAVDAIAREFATEHSERLWKQLILPTDAAEQEVEGRRRETIVVIGLALVAAAAIKVPALFGLTIFDGDDSHFLFYARNASFFVLPVLVSYFAWKRGMSLGRSALLAVPFLVAAGAVNGYPYSSGGATEVLSILHLPIALWLGVGIAYGGGHWRDTGWRMNFVRFSGELFIYYILIACGGVVLMMLTFVMFNAIGIDVEPVVQAWLIPCGGAGAVIIGSWLVEAKQSVVENMAPVLTRIFTPMFAVVLLVFLATMAWSGGGIDIERNVLIGFDLLLILVLGLLLYAISARDPHTGPGVFDGVQLLLVTTALIVDLVALTAIAARISEFGFSPNKVAALGENVVLLVNLVWSAWLYVRFLRGRTPFSTLERWQTSYLPVYSLWAAVVVALFPPLFGFL